jgi:hypothetical protein
MSTTSTETQIALGQREKDEGTVVGQVRIRVFRFAMPVTQAMLTARRFENQPMTNFNGPKLGRLDSGPCRLDELA